MDIEKLEDVRDFATLDKLKQVFREKFQEKYDFELYIAPCTDEWMGKFEAAFLDLDQPWEKLFDSSFLKQVLPKMHRTIPLTLYVFLGEDKETGLYRQTLAEFVSTMNA